MNHSRTRRSAALQRVLAGAAASALCLGAGPAQADRLWGTRSDRVVERSHQIALRLDRGHAELVVRRTVHNGGRRHDQAIYLINVPAGAVATGLATLGVKDGQPFWFRGELMEAQAAAVKYMELTGVGGYYPKDPALLSWRSQEVLALQVFPCAPAQPKTVEYTLRMPTEYREGRHHLLLPRVGLPGAAATALLSTAHRGDRLFVDGAPVAAGAAVKLDKEETVIALAPRPSFEMDGALASVSFAKGRELVQFHLDAPAKLSPMPQNARVVVLLDASRSVAESDAAAGIAAARAYLGHLRDAAVEVVTFDRKVRPRHGRFVPAARAVADLEKLTLEQRNGSAIDAALAHADALLAATPSSLPRRILAITDLQTRSRLTPERLTQM